MGAADAEGRGPIKVLFFMRAIHDGRMVENVLRTLLGRGHEVHVALGVSKQKHGPDGDRLFNELADTYHRFSYRHLAPRQGPWEGVAHTLRCALDYLPYLTPEYASAQALRCRAAERAPRIVRVAVAKRPMRILRVGLVKALLAPLEAAMPIPPDVDELIRSYRPNVIMVTPLIGLGSPEVDYLRAAAAAAVPTVFAVASWDNLSNKGALRETPTSTIVWNQTQVDEAVRLQGLPRNRVVAVGAHSFDHWFQWAPHADRATLLASCRLDPNQPYVVYAGSAPFTADDEAIFVSEWLSRVREHPRLRDVGIIARPHPYNTDGWDALRDEPGRVAVWPRGGEVPESAPSRQAYFDTLHYSAAVVGVSTTAFLEAAILGKPSFTLRNDYFPTPPGTLHFAYIADDGTGAGTVTVAEPGSSISPRSPLRSTIHRTVRRARGGS